VCDTVCVLGADGTLFAKNSDRPVTEAQVVEHHGRRAAGSDLRTQYLTIDDPGAWASVLSRPVWLWGAEHGVNEHRVAIGNEMVNTRDDPRSAAPALIGMDLVRLGLERASSADEAVAVMTDLLDRHGQGGVGDAVNDMAYWSSFLVADPHAAWVLETSGRAWAARQVSGGDAISNRLTLRTDWTRASAGVLPGTDVDSWRDPAVSTAFTDGRLGASRAFVERRLAASTAHVPSSGARAAVAHLRDHGTGPWGAPGDAGPVVPAPGDTGVDGDGVTVCMHVRDFETTTASMVAVLPARSEEPARLWVAVGSPCASVFVPTLAPSAGDGARPRPGAGAFPALLADDAFAQRMAQVARVAERDGDVLARVRGVLAPLEAELWDEADVMGGEPVAWKAFADSASRRVGDAVDGLLAAGMRAR
jgi:secernin